MDSEWSEERVLALISELTECPCLWDPRDKDRKNRSKRNACYKALSVKFECTPEEIRKKFSNLQQTYRSCRRKMKHSKDCGTGRDDVYKPVWFAYDALHKFMGNVYVPQKVTDSATQEKESDIEGNDDVTCRKSEDTEKYIIRMTADEENVKKVTDEVLNNPSCKRSISSPPNNSLNNKRNFLLSSDPRVDEAYEYLVTKKKREKERVLHKGKDECAIFGELVAAKLRKMDEYTRQCVMNDINNLMFQAAIQNTSCFSQFGHFSQISPTHTYSSQSSPTPSYSSQPSPTHSHSSHGYCE